MQRPHLPLPLPLSSPFPPSLPPPVSCCSPHLNLALCLSAPAPARLVSQPPVLHNHSTPHLAIDPTTTLHYQGRTEAACSAWATPAAAGCQGPGPVGAQALSSGCQQRHQRAQAARLPPPLPQTPPKNPSTTPYASSPVPSRHSTPAALPVVAQPLAARPSRAGRQGAEATRRALAAAAWPCAGRRVAGAALRHGGPARGCRGWGLVIASFLLLLSGIGHPVGSSIGPALYAFAPAVSYPRVHLCGRRLARSLLPRTFPWRRGGAHSC